MLLVAVEQSEPPGRRLVDDELAVQFLPAPVRWLVNSAPPNLLRRLTLAAMEREGPGLWASLICRKRYIADTVSAALGSIDAVVVLGAGFDTLEGVFSALRAARDAWPMTVAWIDTAVLLLTVAVVHLALLTWESRHVSLTLGYPGLKPGRQ